MKTKDSPENWREDGSQVSTSKKVFKLKELTLEAGGRADLSISRAIRDFTTRIHYPGLHRVELIINGETLADAAFELTA